MVEKITIGTFGREVIKFDDKNDSQWKTFYWGSFGLADILSIFAELETFVTGNTISYIFWVTVNTLIND